MDVDYTIEGARDCLYRWLPCVEPEEKLSLVECIEASNRNNIYGSNFLKEMDRLGEEANLFFQEGTHLAGSAFYFGCLILCACQKQHISKKDSALLFDFTAMYMLADNYLDDVSIPMPKKKEFVKHAHQILKEELLEDIPDKQMSTYLKVLFERYMHICQHSKYGKSYLISAFEAEMLSVKIQSNFNLDYSVYKEVAERKGGTTVQALQAIIDMPVTDVEYELGALIQYTDDLMDISDDLQMKICTPAVKCIQLHGYADQVLFETFIRWDRIPEKYNIFKPLSFTMIILGIYDNKKYFSSNVLQMIESRNYFHYEGIKTYRELYQEITTENLRQLKLVKKINRDRMQRIFDL